MFNIIAVAVVAAAAGVFALISRRPSTFIVERSAHISAPAQKIFALVSDFHEWSRWSPWEKIDPDMQRTISGAERGEGAVYEWEGNKKAGAGRMEIREATEPNHILIDLHFLKPFKSENVTEFQFDELNGGTTVTWTMEGPANFLTKAMSTFMSLEKMIGKDFENGLAKLKSEAEA